METSGHSIDQLNVKAGERENDVVTFAISGELDPHTAPLLEEALAPIFEDTEIQTVTLDIKELSFIDASGLRVIIAHQQRLAQTSKELAIKDPSETISRLLEITGLDQHLTIIRSNQAKE